MYLKVIFSIILLYSGAIYSSELNPLSNIVCPEKYSHNSGYSIKNRKREMLDNLMYSVFKVWEKKGDSKHYCDSYCTDKKNACMKLKDSNTDICPVGTASLINTSGYVISAAHVLNNTNDTKYYLSLYLDDDNEIFLNIDNKIINNNNDIAIAKITSDDWEANGKYLKPITLHYGFDSIGIDEEFHLLGYKLEEDTPFFLDNLGRRMQYKPDIFADKTFSGQSGSLLLLSNGSAYATLSGQDPDEETTLRAQSLVGAGDLIQNSVSGDYEEDIKTITIEENGSKIIPKYKVNLLMRRDWGKATMISFYLYSTVLDTIDSVIDEEQKGNNITSTINDFYKDYAGGIINTNTKSRYENQDKLLKLVECTLTPLASKAMEKGLRYLHLKNENKNNDELEYIAEILGKKLIEIGNEKTKVAVNLSQIENISRMLLPMSISKIEEVVPIFLLSEKLINDPVSNKKNINNLGYKITDIYNKAISTGISVPVPIFTTPSKERIYSDDVSKVLFDAASLAIYNNDNIEDIEGIKNMLTVEADINDNGSKEDNDSKEKEERASAGYLLSKKIKNADLIGKYESRLKNMNVGASASIDLATEKIMTDKINIIKPSQNILQP